MDVAFPGKGSPKMAEGTKGAGERVEAARARRKRTGFFVLFGIGMALGMAVGVWLVGKGLDSVVNEATDWPPALALGLLAAWIGAVLGGGIFIARQTDEFARYRDQRAVAAAGSVFFLGYPAWFLLWKSGMAPEPMHGVLWLVFWFVMMTVAVASWLRANRR